MAIFQKRTSPSFAISSRTKSASPTDTPPEVMTTSALAAAAANARSSASGSSRTTPMSMTSQPSRDNMPWIV